jgi:putative DNA primase/helicase
MTATENFRDAIRAAGLTPPDLIEPGRFHRFPGEGKRNGNTAGFCKLFPDERGGIFGDFSTGIVELASPNNRGQ